MKFKFALSRFFILVSLTGCASIPGLPKPEIKGIKPRIESLDFQGVNLAFDVDVNNPYPTAIKTPKFKYGLDVQGASFMNSSASTALDLPARNIGTATLPIRLTYADLWKSYQNLKDAKEIDYTLKGALQLPFMGTTHELPLSHSGKFPVLRIPKISILKIEPANISLTKAGVGVEAEMMNPNIFGIGLGDIGYALNLGSISVGGLKATSLQEIGANQTGRFSLRGEVSALEAAQQFLKSPDIGAARLVPTGSIQTPYGPVKLDNFFK